MSPRHWLLLLALSLIWGATFPIAKYSVGTIPPLVLTFFRVLLAALTLHMVLRLRGIAFPLERRLFGAFLLMGLLNNAIPFSLIFWGQTVLPASLASILNATTPIFTVLVASLVFGQERLAAHRVAGILIGFMGVAILLAAGLDVGILQGVAGAPPWAQLLCLGGALSYAFAASFAKRFRGMPVLVSAAGQLTGSSIIMAPLAFAQAFGLIGGGSFRFEVAGPGVWMAVVALGVVCTALAYLIYFRLLVEAGATNASLVTLLVPVSACLIGAVALGETLGLPQLIGMGLLLLGLVVLDGRVLRRARAGQAGVSAGSTETRSAKRS
ncbi:MAG: EamA family transporter [Stappia sp.]|jgi:drug/metabolite transporter (DMT)-like permease|nr:EamA family transporter [Stappia sp.]